MRVHIGVDVFARDSGVIWQRENIKGGMKKKKKKKKQRGEKGRGEGGGREEGSFARSDQLSSVLRHCRECYTCHSTRQPCSRCVMSLYTCETDVVYYERKNNQRGHKDFSRCCCNSVRLSHLSLYSKRFCGQSCFYADVRT